MKTSAVLLLVFVLLETLSGFSAAHAQGAGNFCPPNRAEETTVAKIAADPKAWMGKCITVSAIYNSERLYSDIDAIYGKPGGSIGGFVDGKGSIEGFWTGKFTGRVADCKVAEDELATGLLRSPGISLDGRTLGCVNPEGPFLLFMSQREFAPATLVRRLRKSVGADGGDLKPAGKDWPNLAAVEKVAHDVVEALRAGDAKTLTGYGMRPFTAEQLLTSEATAIADLRKPGNRPLQVLTDRTSNAAEACFCRTKDCSAKWPIASRDADNQTSRPYACIRVTPKGEGGYDADASADFDGLPEPK
jgi:hypothetical protein